MPIIDVQHLHKSFKIYKKEPGFAGSIKSLFHRKYEKKDAVKDISFTIEEGELIGFIGPNGAGKTTTLKMLSGLLYPSSGHVSVLGFTPFDRKNEFLKQISLVMGQKNQLWWELPAMETFLLNKAIYDLDKNDFNQKLSELTELLDVKDILNVEVRKLSLGQRMKCELILSLLHNPKVLFLDEPTIGLDVVTQQKLREFLKEYNKLHKTTIILTSHYMQDVKELCERVIIINHGSLLFNGALDDVIRKFAKDKLITITFKEKVNKSAIEKFGEIVDFQPYITTFKVPLNKSHDVASKLLRTFEVEDLNVEDTPIEDVIIKVFMQSHEKHIEQK